VGFETNSGIAEASQFTNHHFQNATVGVNYGGFFSLLSPTDKVSFLPNTVAPLGANITSARYDVVLVWQQSRTVLLPSGFFDVLNEHFTHETVFGLSNFSYVTVYYNSSLP